MGRARIIALVGPTAVGKTDVAMALADRYPIALISLDSALVYRGMDIGTAKPEPRLLARYPHALIDLVDPTEPYSAARYVSDADQAVKSALAAGRIPLLVGGTMLYLKAFREGLAPMPSADPVTRARLVEEARRTGLERLHARLQQVDPIAAERIHPNNFSRIQRALEVFDLSGRAISSFWDAGEDVSVRHGAQLTEIAIQPDSREALHQRISHRLDAMLAGGFLEEVRALRARGDLDLDLPAMRAVGYRQIWEHLDGLTDLDQMRARALAATRQLAKRQLTWLRGWPQLEHFQWGDADAIARAVAARIGLDA